ncbi:hypothetical protein [Dongshaea marina]|uniref:hypothetical protein n=1 Tax=Dongshaea marina TaxID=2047966 RepID=UPI000D3EC33E|nr:hypothetical protein [Dongshaea marina]
MAKKPKQGDRWASMADREKVSRALFECGQWMSAQDVSGAIGLSHRKAELALKEVFNTNLDFEKKIKDGVFYYRVTPTIKLWKHVMTSPIVVPLQDGQLN